MVRLPADRRLCTRSSRGEVHDASGAALAVWEAWALDAPAQAAVAALWASAELGGPAVAAGELARFYGRPVSRAERTIYI